MPMCPPGRSSNRKPTGLRRSCSPHGRSNAVQPLAERQRAFKAALLDRTLPVPLGLVGPDGESSARRFGVYRNNVLVSLTEALRETYPAVCRIVGDEFFRAMARMYVLASPPASPVLLDYGAS